MSAPAGTVRRQRLLSTLDGARHRRLTLVVAPAGYGKTTLLSDWAESNALGPVAWCNVRPEHNQAEALSILLGAVRRTRTRTLVLDDFHQLTDPRRLDECAAFIEQAPDTLHVVIASRVEPPARYYRFRLSDSLAELDARDLAFTEDEASKLMLQATGAGGAAAPIDDVIAKTAGWAMGLALLGHERGIHDYLTTEVFDRQSADVRSFMLATSVLERMSGPLCDFLTPGHHSQAMLEDLAAGGCFVTASDPRLDWFEYHPLFRAMLRRHLANADPEAESTLLRRASEWHLNRGDVEDGVRCLIDAGAGDEVIEAAFTHGPTIFERQCVSEVAGWIQTATPPERLPASGNLLEAAALIFGNSPLGVRQLLDRVRAMPEATPGEVLVGDLLRAYLGLVDGTKDIVIRSANRVLRTVDTVDAANLPNIFGLTGSRSDVTAGALVARAVARMYDGRLASARRDLDDVDDEVHGVWQASALGARGLVEAWSGNLREGEELATRALLLADSLGHDSASRTTAWLALALVARHRGELDRAASLLEDVEWAGGTKRRAVAVWVAAERAFIALATGAAPVGLAVLAGQLASAHPSLPTGVLARRMAAEALLRMATGDLDGAEALVELPSETKSSLLTAARVRHAVERGDIAQARAFVADWPGEQDPRSRREQLLWTSILSHLDGDEAQACSTMAAVVAEAETEGDVGLFQPAGKHALGPVRALYRAAPTVFLRALADAPIAATPVQPAKGLPEQLTDREYMVLVHLPSRQSNAEIAVRLGVSLNTVKTHLKHIYRKLDAAGRSEAVDAAEKLHLL